MNSKTVSIIIPAYNVEKYISKCIESALSQTYPYIEVIAVDDCSDDSTYEILKKAAEIHPNLTVLKHDVNRKQGAARNTGADAAHGDYLFFLDSDDVLPRDAVSVLVRKAEEENADIVIGNMAWLKNGVLIPVEYISAAINRFLLTPCGNLRQLHASDWFIGSASNKLYNARWLKDNNIRFVEGIYWEDVHYCTVTWIKAERIAFTDRVIYFRTERTDENNLSTTQSFGMKKFTDRDILVDCIFEALEKKCREDSAFAENAAAILNRILYTTEKITENADNDISEDVRIWFSHHREKNDEMRQKLSSYRSRNI